MTNNNSVTFEDLKLRLTPGQRKAAELLVTNDFIGREEKKTLPGIAEELGIDRRTLFNWRQNPDFTRYLSAISDNRLDQYRSVADAQLLKLVEGTSNNGLPSIRGLELYYSMVGRLKQAPMIQFNDHKTPTISREEASEELAKLKVIE